MIVLIKAAQVLRPGASVIVRDYGLYDHAMVRFGAEAKLDERCYVRQDGTMAYYFDLGGRRSHDEFTILAETLRTLFESCGYVTDTAVYVNKTTTNRKEATSVRRTFVQGRFIRPKL